MTVALAALVLAHSSAALSLADGFRSVPMDSRMRMYWRVFGPAWAPAEMDYELDQLKSVGVGGLTVYFMYPFDLDDPAKGVKNLRFGSPEFLESFRYAADAAKRRGLSFGLNGSTGWPFGGPTVSIADSAQRIREVVVPAGGDLSKARPGKDDQVVAAFQNGKRVDPLRIDNLTEARVYLAVPTRMQVKRPAFGGEGLVVNHYDRGALDRYLSSVVEPMLKAGGGTVKNLGCDSLEVYSSNWTRDLPDAFRKRKGYDLTDHLPELFDAKSEAGKKVRFDFWQTLAELTEERFTKPLGQWCASRGLALEMEPYGTPPNPMTATRYIQTPTGEHYEWKGFSVQKYVASSAHQAGKAIVSSEAWTWSGLPNRLADSLSDLKLVTDMTFLAGSNDLMAVDYPYSPRSAGSPGWVPYYGPFMGPGNSQWPMFPALVDYANRCQWMLRKGEPVRDVAVYLPVEDSFRDGPTDQMTLDFYVRDKLVTGKATSEFGLNNALKHQSDLVHGLISAGFDYDGIDFWTMNRIADIEGDLLAVGPARYRALVLPNLETMDVDAMRKALAFCRAGGTVIATRRLPSHTPGFADSFSELHDLEDELFGVAPRYGRIHEVGKGVAALLRDDRDAAYAIAQRIKPSVQYATLPTTVGFQHRRTRSEDIFFFANVGPNPVHLDLALNCRAQNLELWDALSDRMTTLPAGRRVHLDLPQRGSAFLVAGSPTPGVLPAGPSAARTAMVDVAGPWLLRFEGPDAPAHTTLSDVGSWADLIASKFFSGTGIYSTTFDWKGSGERVFLELGDVREAASVKLNDMACGTVIVPPFDVEITRQLHVGSNRLEISVVNLPVNRFIGQPRPDLGPLRKVYGNRFPVPEEHDLMKGVPAPSGLLGPVRLRVESSN
jgi:hypothetical protein